jgi:hypothetical protein
MELENIILSEVSQAQEVKATCSVLYADYRLKTNAVILWDTGYTKVKLCKGGIGQGKETKNLNVVDMLTVQE